eukprot:m.1014044 g.1014044  ORF g.1014044 m.1014044 type:complete len:219 (-) comp24068_c0_seq36:3389-4045(-)
MDVSTSVKKRSLHFTVCFLYALGFAITQPVLPFFTTELFNAHEPQVSSSWWSRLEWFLYASIFSAYPLAKIPMTPVAGHVADIHGVATTLAATLLALSTCFALTGAQSTFLGLFVCRIGTGVCGATGALLQAWIPHLVASSTDHIVYFSDNVLALNLANVVVRAMLSGDCIQLWVQFAVRSRPSNREGRQCMQYWLGGRGRAIHPGPCVLEVGRATPA